MRFRNAAVAALLVAPSLLATLAAPASSAQKRALFDNLHAQTAGNADWIIDNNQPVPSPAQSAITWATSETYWQGAISAWGVALVKRGFTVTTLSTPNPLTYGNTGNPYDLANFDIFIVDEPNTRFTSAESTAIFNYVRDGGGLIAIADHMISDRNNDGVDSPRIWNRLDNLRAWGVVFDTTSTLANSNFTQNSGNVETSPSDSIIHGPAGLADSISFHNGTSMLLLPAINPTVRGDIWKNGLAHGNPGVMVAHSLYGNGRIVFCGDSSPPDDGTASGSDNVFNGWAEATGRDSLVFLNATLWATRRDAVDAIPPVVHVISPNGGEVWGADQPSVIRWTASDDVALDSVNVDLSLNGGAGPWYTIQHGVTGRDSLELAWPTSSGVSDSALVRVTAFDHALNSAVDSSDDLFRIVSSTAVGPATNPGLTLAIPSPNPSSGGVVLRFALPRAGPVRLEVLDLAGRRVWSAPATLDAGRHEMRWEPRGARAGLYLVRLVTPWGTRTTRLVHTP